MTTLYGVHVLLLHQLWVCAPCPVEFRLNKAADPSLRDLVERILPLGTYYTAISAFVEHRSDLDYGLINHALCATIRDMLRDYQTLLSQLEHAFNTSPQFSLQKLWFYVHPTIHTLFLIYQLVLELGTTDDPAPSSSSSSSPSPSDVVNVAAESGILVKGGEVLTIVYERMQNMSGDPTAHKLYSTLLRAAGAPYVSMLNVWTTTGRLVDPYEELCVKERKFINRGILEMDYTDEYWERRYTVSDRDWAYCRVHDILTVAFDS